MPIIEMKKVFLLGHRQERENIFNVLHDLGSLELMDIKSSEAWEDFETLVEPEHAGEALSRTETALSELRYCLDFLHRYYPARKSFVEQFTGGKLDLSESDFNEYIARLEEARDVYNSCHESEEIMARIRNEETQTKNLIEALEPWADSSVPLEELGRSSFAIIGLYTVPVDNVESLQASLEEKVPNHYFEQISSDNEYVYFFFTGLTEDEEEMQEAFKENTVSVVSFPDMDGTASENIERQYKKTEELNSERETVLKEIEALLKHRPMLMACYDYISNEVEKHEAVTNLARTENSFLLEGWVPAPVLSDLEQTIEEKTETAVLTSRDPEPGENVPVLLHNQGPVEAYEVVTKLYSTPKRGELDPTPYMAPFFFVFFGICLSDAGYGIALSLLAFFISRKLKLEGMGKQLIYLLFLGGISAFIFGILFGGYFGDLIKLPPLWFNPLDEPMRMLFYCFVIGLFHVYFGMAVQAYRNIKAGQLMSAVYDQGFWFLFINGLIIMLALPELETVGQWLTITAGAGLVLSQGRHQSGIVMKFMSGLLSLYNITGYLSDVLSYSRLLALGLASIVIATAINAMSDMVGGTIIGTVIMILVLLGGHAFNIIISTLSSYVHTSRLQYIEFFSKFFEGGGKAFKPFRAQTSYVDITEPENS